MYRRFAVSITMFVVLVALVFACNRDMRSTSSQTQQEGQTFPDAQSAANQALATFRKLVDAQNYKELGFESPDEIANASLGQPMRTTMVQLDQLKAYKAGDDPNRLLVDINKVYYPVTVQNNVRSAINLEQSNGRWRAAGFGPANLAKQIARGRSAGPSNAEQILVHIAPFNLYFTGYRADGRLMLTPVADNANFNLRAGATRPAEEIFAALVPLAQQYNGLPI